MAGSDIEVRTRRLLVAERGMDAAGGILHRHGLWPARLLVALDAAQARQQVADLAGDHVGVVELGGDMHGEPLATPVRLQPRALGHGAQEVAAETDEAAHGALQQRLADLHRRHPLLARRLETVELFQPVERRQFGLLGDADRALALHVGVAAHRTRPRARPPDVAAQHQEVADHVHVLDAEMVLGEAHAVDGDHRLGLRVGLGGALQVGAREARLALDVAPVGGAAEGGERLEAGCVQADEGVVEHLRVIGGAGRVVLLDHMLAKSGHGGEIAPGLDLQVLRRDRGRAPGQHLERVLRIDEPLQRPLLQRVEHHDRRAALGGVLQVVEHPRAVGPDVLAEEEDRVGLGEVLQLHGADRAADALLQADRGRTRGTCWSCRGGSGCRTSARRARTCRPSPATRGPRRRRSRRLASAPSARGRSRRTPRPSRKQRTCRWLDRSAAAR